MMKNAFNFILKTLFVRNILKFLLSFRHVGKWLDKKEKFNFRIYYVINWETNNHNTCTRIAHYLKK